MSSLAAVIALHLAAGQIRHVDHHHSVTPPSQLTVGDQYYEGNLKGLRHYLTDSRELDPELHSLLDPELLRLERQAGNGWLVIGVGAAAAAVTIGLSGYMIATTPPLGDPPWPEGAFEERGERFKTWFAVGMGGMLGALAIGVVGVLMMPTRTQVMELINHHNRLRPERPLRFQLGFAPSLDGRGGTAFAFATF